MRKGIAIFLLLGAAAMAQESPTHNGNWWRTIPYDMRVGYVMGYLEGGCHQESDVLASLNPLSDEQRSKIPSCVFPNQTTFGQIVDAMDQFYHDANNRLIWSENAFDCVRAALYGKPFPQKEIARMRRSAAEFPATASK
jgi:hypothetical protein